MKRLVLNNPSIFGGESLAEFALSNFFQDPVTFSSNNDYWVSESDDFIDFELDVPGFEKKDLIIEYKDNVLTIQANKESKKAQNRQLNRSFTVENIDINKSTADLEHGVLKLKLEKLGHSKKQTLKIS